MNIKSIIASSAMIIAGAAIASADMFADVPANHWAYQAVSSLADKGIIEGFPNNTFKGEQNVTRYQLAIVTAKLLAKAEQGGMGDKDLSSLEKLTVEFADELALLGVKVTSLEDDMQILKDDVAGLKNDMNNIKSSLRNGEFEKVRLSGDMLVRHTSTDVCDGDRDARTTTKIRLRMDAQVAENIKAVARWRMVDNNHDNALPGNMGAAWNGSNHSTAEVDTAFLEIKDMFGFGGDFTFGRRFFTHGHALVLNNYLDAVTYNKTSGDVELSFNLIFARQINDDTHNIWNINADTKYRGHDLYLGFYYRSLTAAFMRNITFGDYDKNSNSKAFDIEFGAKGDLGNNGYWSYDLGAVYQVCKDEKVNNAVVPTQYDDNKGWMLHGAINWDSKEQWAMKVAYTMVDDEAAMHNISFDERYNDGTENPLEDIMRGVNFDNQFGFTTGIRNQNAYVSNLQDIKIQLEYRPNKTSKHYFRVAYDMVKPKDDNTDGNGFFTGRPGDCNKADVVNFEYRYRLAENTRIRLGYTDLRYGTGNDANVGHHKDYGMFWSEIYSRF